ncbi:MAG: GH3 auxin-responsive promoter family protein [Saprospiraceae bacterium]|nr:GH3 auxin-responsive promoter family protein [Saprospiraceae bacterium]
MRKGVNAVFRYYYAQRYRIMQRFMQRPHEVQRGVLRDLLQAARHTEYGKNHRFSELISFSDFSTSVPVTDYEDLKPHIQRMMHGEKDVLWHGQVRWFSKSSGTTSDKSKYIPVSAQNLKRCHIRGSWDTMCLFYHNRHDARQFELKSMVMGGSLQSFDPYPKTLYGDVSAIMISRMPWVGKPFYTPDFQTALLADWEVKLERMAQQTAYDQRIVMIGGVPTWTVMLFRRILDITGKKNMLEVWPNFQVYIHGGVSFTPYREQFRSFFPSDSVSYQEIYNASEGYFAVQDNFDEEGMLLLLNNGMYFEFIPMSEWGEEAPKTIPLQDVEVGKNYAIVISTNAGLWRYQPGDTIAFTSTNPYRIKVTGRTKQFVNAFGEEVMVDNTDQALEKACAYTGAQVHEYTVAPIYFKEGARGGHEWLIEFERPPDNLERFTNYLDQSLQKINSDYEAKRHKNIALQCLKVLPVPSGTFSSWMRYRGKFGGQHKVPRLANDRKYVSDILDFLGERVG